MNSETSNSIPKKKMMSNFKNKPIRSIWILTVFLLINIACSSEDPDAVNEEEVITTVTVNFTNNGMTDEVVTASFRDLDGPGGMNPTTDAIVLNSNSSYTYRLEFLNEQVTPVEDITAEVRTEGTDHQVFTFSNNSLDIMSTYGDQDSNGNPIGLTGTLTTGSAGSGTYTVVLVHKPNKSASGVSSGNLNAAGGEEDIRVLFNMSIQ